MAHFDRPIQSRFRSYLYYSTDTAVRQYFWNPVLQKVDGTENTIAEIMTPQSPNDIVTHVGYDSYGRMEKEWLPYRETVGNVGSFRTGAEASTDDYYELNYASDVDITFPNPFSQKDFEASPLNRILKQAAPGDDWSLGGGNEIEFGYEVNAANEVRLMSVTTSYGNNTYVPSLDDGNGTVYYAAGKLYKNITRDENHTGTTKNHTTEEFTDKMGRVVLKRTYADVDLDESGGIGTGETEIPHDTYYVYDDYGNLTYVLPPKVDTGNGVSATELSELCYQYVYDHRNRLVEKKIPGKDWEYVIYNMLDQPIMTQDANLRANNNWLFTRYDAFGRMAFTGKVTGGTRTTEQDNATGTSVNWTEQTSSATTVDGTPLYYGTSGYPLLGSVTELHTVNYYDGYDATRDGISLPSGQVLGQDLATNVNGLPTSGRVRVLGTTDWTTTLTGYDEKGRPIWGRSENEYLGTVDVSMSELDFTGRVLKQHNEHTKGTNPVIVTVDSYQYDHVGRLLSHKQDLGGHTETIALNSYDGLGQLENKKVGNTPTSPLQKVDYDYNIRGWLKGINDTGSMGDDLFAFGINYNTPSHGGTGLYNGNIAETEWRSANTDNSQKWYKYGYDALNRITSGMDNTIDQRYSLANVSYDRNGNIKKLNRKGHTAVDGNGFPTAFGTMDDLTYSYMGNQLKAVDDNIASSATQGFVDGAELATEYNYDQNGNMTSDLNKGIPVDGITYNYLNLPTNIVVNSVPSGTISYIYDAMGTKLEKTAGTTTTQYAGNYVYENGTLQFFNQPEGYVTPNGQGGYDYVYQYRDHLGNVRLSYTDSDGNGHINDSGIFNNGFESASGWNTDGTLTEYDSSFKMSGEYSGKIVKTTVGEKFVQSDVWTTIDNANATDYTFSGWVYSDGPTADIFLFMKTETEAGYFTQVSSVRSTTTGQWEYLEKTFSVPSNIKKLNIRIDNNGGGTVWFDDIKIRPAGSEIVQENNYYPFGLEHKGYNSTINGVQNNYFNYNGKELEESLGLDWVDFGFRNYEASIGRWMNVDPLADKMRNNSPYNYAFNNPTLFIDENGLFPIIIHVRSFAPFEYFGAELWHGDNRGFSRNPLASSRLHQISHFKTDNGLSDNSARGSLSSSRYGAFAYSEARLKDYSSKGNINTHMFGNNDAVFPPGTLGNPAPVDGGPTWAIDVHTNLDISVSELEDGNQLLTISGQVSGDTFPNAEAFVSDADGNSVWLGTFATHRGPDWGPFVTLGGDFNDPMIDVNIGIVTNTDGIFQGVRVGDQTISLERWNKDSSGPMSVDKFKKNHRDLYNNLFGSK